MNLRRWLELRWQQGHRANRGAPMVGIESEQAIGPPPAEVDCAPDSTYVADTQEVDQAVEVGPRTGRAERIRTWRRRALLRKGARLYSVMKANSDRGSLAMLDDGGMVISWYERAGNETITTGRVVDNHMSQFYLAADLAIGVPVRDLCTAAIHGSSTQTGWRRFPQGATYWATTVIEPILLRDGRLQGFSHLTRRLPNPQQSVRVATDNKPPLRDWSGARGLGFPASMLIAVLLIVAGSSMQVASAAENSLPQHARKNPYGTGWDCVSGYRRSGDGCMQVVVPANAYLDASGSSWACNRGYRNVDNACVAVRLPAHAYLDNSYGNGWRCGRSYREREGACVAIEIPKNAHAVDSSYGSGWECDRGFRLGAEACVAVVVPVNGYLTGQGDDWKCERGFNKVGNACMAVAVPPNGYLDMQGNGWGCDRGFRKDASQCAVVQVPANAHLSYSGDNWRCDSGFRREGALCMED